jgi:hypothetical protein
MDHDALVRIASRPRRPDQRGTDVAEPLREQLVSWIKESDRTGGPASRGNPHLTSREAALDCAACHGIRDPHFRYLGSNCAECHATVTCTIPEYHACPPRRSLRDFAGIIVRRSVNSRPSRPGVFEEIPLRHRAT